MVNMDPAQAQQLPASPIYHYFGVEGPFLEEARQSSLGVFEKGGGEIKFCSDGKTSKISKRGTIFRLFCGYPL